MSSRREVMLCSVVLLAIVLLAQSMPLEQSDETNIEKSFELAPEGTEEDVDDEMPEDDDEDYVPDDDIQLIQGDIVPEPKGDVEIRNQGVLADQTWPNGVVPYSIHKKSISDVRSIQMIKRAMEAIESVSCIKFKERVKNDRHFIKIVRAANGELCYSTLGRSTDESYFNVGQPLRLDDVCFNKGTIIHQLMHALGFYHEQARTDRDEFVEIVTDNIDSEKEDYFVKTSDPVSVTHLDTPYDYSSIMHYQWNAYAIDKTKPTIKIRNKSAIHSKLVGMGTTGRLSSTDIIEINALYNCSTDGPLLAPDDIQYREGENWVTVYWTLPRVGNNRKVVSYKIYYTTESTLPIEQWHVVIVQNSSAQSWKVSGLLKSTTYTFRMCAVADNGPGLLSNPFHCKTTVSLFRILSDRSSPPQEITGRPGNEHIKLSWKAPQDTNGYIQGYEIYYTDDSSNPLDQWTIKDIPRNQLRYKIDNLLEGTIYSIRMRAINKHGASRLSEPSVNVTTRTREKLLDIF